MTLSQGYDALTKGQLDQAQFFFQQANQTQDPRASIGLGQVFLAKGDLDSSERLAQHAQQQSGLQQGALLRAQVLGDRGQRDAAVNLINDYIRRNNQDGLARAILAEQKIRQGYWNEGTELFTEAFRVDQANVVMVHFEKVMHDMLGAVSQRKIRPIEALKFINKVDHSLPSNDRVNKQRFATFRQMVNSGRALGSPRPVAPLIQLQQPQTRPAPPPQVRQSTTNIASPRTTSQPAKPRSTPQASQVSQAPPLPKAMAWPEKQTLRRPVTPNAPQDDRLAMSLNAKPSNLFAQSMREERRLNEEIQSSIKDMPVPTWPSSQENEIDTIDVIVDTQLSISEIAAERYERDDFRVTHGSIFAEIHLEQCLNSLLLALPLELAGTVPIEPSALTQLEINILDGWLDNLVELPSDPLGEISSDHQEGLAIGTFIGEALARAYTATWEFDDDPKKSYLHLGKETLHPIQHAMRWLASDTKEDFSLRQIRNDAETALPMSRFVHGRATHIDSTLGLSGTALTTRLAELWSFYLFRLARVPYTEFASEIQELWKNNDVIIFRLSEKWCPQLPEAMKLRGKSKRDGYVIAYVRETGEFFMLCSRAHLAQLLPYVMDELTDDSSRLLIRLLTEFHGPSAVYVTHDNDAKKYAQRTNNQNIVGPRIQNHEHGKQMFIWSIEQNTPRLWAIQHFEHNNTWRFLPTR